MVHTNTLSIRLGILAAMVLGSGLALAQSPANSKSAATKSTNGVDSTRTAADVSKSSRNFRRVPPYFGQVGITDEQRETIYSIREKYAIRQAQIEEELAGIQDKIQVECEAVLTPEQRTELIRLKGAAKAKAKSRTKSSAKPSTKDAATKN